MKIKIPPNGFFPKLIVVSTVFFSGMTPLIADNAPVHFSLSNQTNGVLMAYCDTSCTISGNKGGLLLDDVTTGSTSIPVFVPPTSSSAAAMSLVCNAHTTGNVNSCGDVVITEVGAASSFTTQKTTIEWHRLLRNNDEHQHAVVSMAPDLVVSVTCQSDGNAAAPCVQSSASKYPVSKPNKTQTINITVFPK